VNALLSEQELKDWLNVKQRAKLLNLLETQSIPYLIGGGGTIVTTRTAMDQAMLGLPQATGVIPYV
jgi:hypothetical protein